MQDTRAHPAFEDNDMLLAWVLGWSELAAFGALLGAFLVAGYLQPAAFSEGRGHLALSYPLFNTIILISSGWCAAKAACYPAGAPKQRTALLGAAAGGFAFTTVKITEYLGELPLLSGERLETFSQLYFLTTGFHLVHVIFGSLVLIVVAWRPRRENVAIITTLWHVIDIVWLVMFPVVYAI
ncbi:nitric oxide reductase (cytochrome c) subunit E (plasmid) [Rhizobium etli 8C-3]|uniref:Nitric oxide reductase (Cytochrome c) subunit E n=1 Tax=Rhizobium etli 8C-3 TaxID=538025 RepID=A0A1L5PF53_RHIET|nr:cytochrome c oxidase subunit 3 [Rhizobium etli]APO78818.1 nitric oxide reductase (cytochrome c) subunit E [Rhizobium etli 8C-3]